MSGRGFIRRLSLITAVVGGALALGLAMSGGFDLRLLGAHISAHDPFRPLLIGSIALSVFILAGGDTPASVRSAGLALLAGWRVLGGLARFIPSHRALAMSLAVLACLTVWFYGTKAVGGADSWGYLSQAEIWATGSLPKVPQPFARGVPWPDGLGSFTPLAWAPMLHYQGEVPESDEWSLVPIYASGLPLLMATAKVVGGHQAMFFVVPLLFGVMVIATYGIGVRLHSSSAGLIGAWLVATSPAVLFQAVTTMTDTAVAGVWAAAFYFALGRSARSAVGAGLLAAIAVMIRPNLVLLAGVLGLAYAFQLMRRETRMPALGNGALFTVSFLPGPAAVAAINNALYGSPLTSGYGSIDHFFALSHIVPNIKQYLAWLSESQTPLALVGLAATLLPTGRLWPAERRPAVAVAALFVAVLWGFYFVYDPYDAWWYLRFLLSSWPMIMVGVGAVLVRVMAWRPRATKPIVAALLLFVTYFQVEYAEDSSVFDFWAGERRYVVAAQMARRLSARNSVIVSGQHSGSLRYYGGRVTMHYDYLDAEWLDRAVEWMNERGVRTYLLLEDWEVSYVRQRFARQRAMEVLDLPPLAVYREPGRLFLYDLVGRRSPTAEPEMVTGTYRDLWAVPKAPDARLTFKP